MTDCVFCKIAAGEIPANLLYDKDGIIAFRDIHPQAPVHILVVPREHISSAAAISKGNAGVVAQCFTVIAELAEHEGLNASGGFRVITNSGPGAGQTVPHLHFHLLGGMNMSEKLC
jgi:histidine triad (HIT) family protein